MFKLLACLTLTALAADLRTQRSGARYMHNVKLIADTPSGMEDHVLARDLQVQSVLRGSRGSEPTDWYPLQAHCQDSTSARCERCMGNGSYITPSFSGKRDPAFTTKWGEAPTMPQE